VQLRLCGPRANGSHTQHISQELGRDGVEHLAGKRHAPLSQVEEELPRHAQALVDFERVVDVGVVDQTLPADGCARLLEVRAHDNEQVILVLFLQRHQPVAVLEGSFGVVDGARANDDQQSAIGIFALHDGDGFIAPLQDRLS